MQNAALRTAVILDDPLSSIRISARLAPRLRERGIAVLVPTPVPGNLFRDAEECCARAASFAGEFDLIAVGWGAAAALRILTRHLFGKAMLIAPPLSKHLLRVIPDSPFREEILDCALSALRDAYLITGETEILWPESDAAFPTRDVRRFLARVPDSEALVLPGTTAKDLISSCLPAVFSRIFSFFERQNPENTCEKPINVYNR